MKKILLIALSVITIPAFATYPVTNNNQTYHNNNVDVDTNVKATAIGTGIAGASSESTSISGSTSTSSTGNNSANVSGGNTQFNQVRQTPFAYSPGMASSFSQDNCNNSASLGVSAGFGAIGGGMPIASDDCNRRLDAKLWASFGQNRIACERMAQSEENKEAMKAAGVDCAKLTTTTVPVAAIQPVSASNVPSNAQWDRMEMLREAQFNAIMAKKNLKK